MAENYIAKALAFAKKAHEGQFRRDGKPYFTHVEAVADYLDKNWETLVPDYSVWNGFKDDVIAACYGHDLVEDCGATRKQLREAGFSERSIDIIFAVSKRKGENYFDFIMRIRGDYLGSRLVKIADLWHNMSDNPKEGSQLDKYRFADYIGEDKVRDITDKSGKKLYEISVKKL